MSKTDRYDEQRQQSLGVVLLVIASVVGLGLLVGFVSLAIQVLTA